MVPVSKDFYYLVPKPQVLILTLQYITCFYSSVVCISTLLFIILRLVEEVQTLI